MNVISLIDGSDIESSKISKIKNSKVFAFDILSHNFLKKINIDHILADEFLTSKEREDIFDHVASKLYWFENVRIPRNLFIEDKSLLEMLDPLYLQQKLMVILLQFSIIKKIISDEKPQKIYATHNLANIISTFTDSEIEFLNLKHEVVFDTFDLRFTIFSKLISIKISMNTFEKIKNLVETLAGRVYNLWLDLDEKKPIILLLEFDPSQYKTLLHHLNSEKYNIVILNRRKSVMHSFDSIKQMRNSNSKILNFSKLLSNDDKSKINSVKKELRNHMKKFWLENDFEKIFSYNEYSYWNCIKDFLITQYEIGLSDYAKIFFESKILFEKLNIKCILYQYESATSENILLSHRKKIPSLLLRHGFSSYSKKTSDLRWRYDTFRLVKLNCDQILAWGDADYDYYSTFLSENKNVKIIGSPRHDFFFNKSLEKNSSKKTILLTTPPMTEWSGLLDTEVALRYEKTLENVILKIKKLSDVKIIVKLHPGWGWKFNDVLTEIVERIDPSIPIFSIKPIQELISDSDIIINFTPEDNEPSTVMLDALILKKPVIEISLDDRNRNFEYDECFPIISLSYKADIEKYMKKILYDTKFKKEISLKIDETLKHYISNQKTASKILADYLKSF